MRVLSNLASVLGKALTVPLNRASAWPWGPGGLNIRRNQIMSESFQKRHNAASVCKPSLNMLEDPKRTCHLLHRRRPMLRPHEFHLVMR